MAQLLKRKITIKEVVGPVNKGQNFDDIYKAPRIKEGVGETIWLMDVLGQVSAVRPGSSDMGEFVKLLGVFKATNLRTGEIIRSTNCILPNFYSEGIAAAIMNNSRIVEFGVRIGAHYDETSLTKYVYDLLSLTDLSENNPLDALEKKAKQSLELLENTPTPTPTPNDELSPEGTFYSGSEDKKQKRR